MSEWSVPGYTGLKVLGSGGFGEVLLARHDASGVLVAIKYLHYDLLADPEFLGMFRGEAAVLAYLEDANIARLYEYVESPSGAAIVMELIDGVSLREILTHLGGTTPEAALVVLQGSLLGLAAAHQRGVVHRDYKPANVLVNGAGVSKLTDFGIAARAGTRPAAAGTPTYVAPEQMAGAPASPASDVYSATATFYECVTGRPPFDGGLVDLLNQHRTATVPLEPVPEPLRPLVVAGMAKDPWQRPADAVTFVTQLRTIAFAAYGKDWEKRGRSHLAEAALLLAALWPSAAPPAVQVGATQWVTLPQNHRKPRKSRKPPRSRHQLHLLHLWHLRHLLHLLHLRRRSAKAAVAVTAAIVVVAAGAALAVSLNRSHISHQRLHLTSDGSPSHPAISEILPASGGTAGGTPVTIVGTGLSGATRITFGDKIAKVIADPVTRITVMSPPGTGSVRITVTTPTGETTSAGIFTYVSRSSHPPRPVITGISPASGSTAGGTAVTLIGTGLFGATRVSFGGAAGLVTADSDTRITVVSPPVAGTGPVPVTVATVAGISAVAARDTFTYHAPPRRPKKVQAISFTSAVPTHAVVGDRYAVAATGGASGNPVMFSIDSSSASGVCSSSGADGATITFNAAGDCIIDASQAGDTQYQAAPQGQQSVAVSALSQTVTFTSQQPIPAVVGGSYDVSATGGGSGQPVIFSVDSSSAGVCSSSGADGATITFNAAGTCVIDASQAGNAQYLAAPQVRQSVSVSALSQTINFTSQPSDRGDYADVGDTYDVSATGGGSGQPVLFSVDSSSAGVCSSSGPDGATIAFIGAGDCIIDASQAGDARYQAAPQVQQTVSVSALAQNISFNSEPSENGDYGVAGDTYDVAATGGGSGNPVMFSIDSSSGAGVCSSSGADGAVITFNTAGTCIIDAKQVGNTQYQAATMAQQTITVSAPNIT